MCKALDLAAIQSESFHVDKLLQVFLVIGIKCTNVKIIEDQIEELKRHRRKVRFVVR